MGKIKGRKATFLTVPFWIGVCVLFVDQLTKYLTQHYFPPMNGETLWYPYGGIGIFRNFLGIEFSLSYARNRGAAWGVLADYGNLLLAFRLLLIVSLAFFIAFWNKNARWRIPLALILAGAIGNVLDFFIYGHVVDMFHFVFWGFDYPVFNVADSAIFIGVASLIFMGAFGLDHQKAAKRT